MLVMPHDHERVQKPPVLLHRASQPVDAALSVLIVAHDPCPPFPREITWCSAPASSRRSGRAIPEPYRGRPSPATAIGYSRSDPTTPVAVLGALSTGLLVTLHAVEAFRRGVGDVITGVGRKTLGAIGYPPTVVLLFALAGDDPLLFAVPVLILALADALAALIGVTYGRIRYTTADGLKSAEGSLAFFLVAFFSVHVPLLLWTEVGRLETLLVAGTVALLIMLIEATSWRGLDNIFVPLGAYALLRLYMDKAPEELAWRLAATGVLVAAVLVVRRRSSLDDGALIGAALYGYAAWMLGGWRWLTAPAVLFLLHTLVWPRTATRQHHAVHAVVSVTFAGLLWIFTDVFVDAFSFYYPYNVAFAAHMAILGVSNLGWADPPVRHRWLSPLLHAIWATALGLGLPLVLEAWPAGDATLRSLLGRIGAGWLLVLLAASGYTLAIPWLYFPRLNPLRIHTTSAVLALLASAVASVEPLVGPLFSL